MKLTQAQIQTIADAARDAAVASIHASFAEVGCSELVDLPDFAITVMSSEGDVVSDVFCDGKA